MPTDWSAWPLVTVHAGDAPIEDGRAHLMGVLEEALARDEAFAVVAVLPERASVGRDGRARGIVGRLRSVRPGLRERCRGIAFVVSPETAARASKVVRAGSVIMSCPTTVAHDVEIGRRWARERLAAAGSAC